MIKKSEMKKEEIVNQYLKKLSFDKPIKNLEDITKLIQAHISTFAFSSGKVLLKNEISLELPDIYETIIKQKRGGYCFEHNKFFHEVLKELGFDIEFFLARVINNTNNEVPQTHRFSILNFKGEKYLIDVGVGFHSPSIPVKFGNEINKGHLNIGYKVETYEDNTLGLVKIENNLPYRVTQFDMNPCYETDFEMGHFYSHKHPSAIFVNNFVVSLINENEIRSLRNGNYFKIFEHGVEEIPIHSEKELKSILENDLNSYFEEEEIKYLYTNYVKEKEND